MQRDAASARAVGVNQLSHFAIELRLSQRLDHDVALPGAIGRLAPMLNRTPPADAEMRAERRDALGACHLDREQSSAIGMAMQLGNFNRLAAQRIRHINRPAVSNSDAVAEMTDMIDQKMLNHGARRERILRCRHRLRSRTGTP